MPAYLSPRIFLIGAIWIGVTLPSQAQSIPLAAERNHSEYVLATPNPTDQHYLIVGSLADSSRTTRITLRTQSAVGPEYTPQEKSILDPAWKQKIDSQASFLERQRQERPAQSRFPPQAAPLPSKTFHLFTGERDLENSANYQVVLADLCVLGRLAQVYVDRADRNIPGLDKTIAEVLRLYEQEIGPWSEQHLGRVLDVDRDGRFTILLTRKLAAMQNGKVQIDGFVRGSDFFRDLPTPFSNHCDMLYLNAGLKPGPHLRTVMAHEYAHAVTFCEHALTPYRDGPTNQDEESWLNEGVSHLVENPAEFGWSNLDRRVSAYLSGPERYPLVVADYFGSGLWRNPGTRGATFLFLRSCQTQTDADLTRRLIQSPLRGIANLETATRKPFAELFRQACVDLLLPCNYGYLDKDHNGPFLCGPHYLDVPMDNGHAKQTIAGTAAAFFLLHSPGGSFTRLQVDADGPVQLTLVRVPPATPRLSLEWEKGPENMRLCVTAHNGAVQIRAAGWECVTDSGDFQCFDHEWLRAGTTMRSQPIPKPTNLEPDALFKVWAVDAHNHPVAGWIEPVTP